MLCGRHFYLAIFVCVAVTSGAGRLAMADEGVAADACVVALNLPEGATVTVDGRDYGTKRKLTFNRLERGRYYTSQLTIRFSSASETTRTLLFCGGWRVPLALRDASLPRPELVLQKPENLGGAPSFSPLSRDGRFVAAGVTERDSATALIDVTTGRTMRTYDVSDVHGDAESATLTFNDDATRLAAGLENRVVIWDVATGKRTHEFAGPAKSFASRLQFSSDGRRLAAFFVFFPPSKSAGRVIVCDIDRGIEFRAIDIPFGLNEATFSPRGDRLAAWTEVSPWSARNSNGQGEVTVWDVDNGAQLRTCQHASAVKALAFSPDGNHFSVATGGCGYGLPPTEIAVYDSRSCETISALSYGRVVPQNKRGSDTRRSILQFSDDGDRLLSLAPDEEAILWDAISGARLWSLPASPYSGSAARFGRDDQQVLISGYWHDSSSLAAVRQEAWETLLVDVITGEIIQRFSARGEGLAFREDGILIGEQVFDAQTGKQVRWIRRDFMEQTSPAVLTAEGAVLRDVFWNFNEGRRVRTFAGGTELLAADGRYAVMFKWAPDSGQLAMREISTGKTIWITPGSGPVAVSKDGNKLLTSAAKYSDNQLTLRDASSGTALLDLNPGGRAVSASFSPDGSKLLIVAYTAGYVLLPRGDGKFDPPYSLAIYETKSGKKTRALEGQGWHCCGAFSPDGRHVLTAGYGGAVLWDIETGKPRRTFQLDHSQVRFVQVHVIPRTGKPFFAFRHKGLGVTQVAFNNNGQAFAMVTNGPELTIWETTTARKLRTIQTPPTSDSFVRSCSFSRDDKKLLTASTYSAAIWDISTGEQLASLLNYGRISGWLVTTPAGLFDGSQGARQAITYRVGNGLNVVPVDRFFQDFYRPGLLAEIWRGERPMPDVKFGTSVPPTLAIVSPKRGTVETPEATIEVDAVDQGGGVANLAIYQNGARVLAKGETRQEGKTVHRTFTLALVEGENRLKVTAASADGSWEAEPAEIVLNYEKPLDKSELYVLAVGVNRYADGNLNLNYAAKDAHALTELFERRGGTLYSKVHTAELVDDKATRAGIKDSLKAIAARTRPQDTLVVFLAGHGTMVGQRYYFVPHEMRKEADQLEDDLRRQGLPADELSEYMGAAKALKRVLILDTCASGGALGPAIKSRSGFALRGAVERLARTQGVFTIAAASASDEAQESAELGHGVLSYALLAGLKAVDSGPLAGKYVQPSNPEQVVDVMEWFTFAAGQVPRLTEKLYGAPQDAPVSTQGTSFPVLPLSD